MASLRSKRTGFKFRRQHSIGSYIVDFYCSEAKLAIELDGLIHLKQVEHDQERQQFIEGNKIKVLQVKNEAILKNLRSTLKQIETAAQANLTRSSLAVDTEREER